MNIRGRAAGRDPDLEGFRFKRSFRPLERTIELMLLLAASVAIIVSIAIIYTLMDGTVAFFSAPDVNIFEFLFGTKWVPSGSDPSFGILPLLSGTILIAGGALLIAMPLGIGAAIYLSEFASPRVRGILKPIIEVLAGIPSIVYGFFALLVISPIFRDLFGASYFNAASAIVVLAIMILPIVVSISDDAMKAVPRNLREASYAMGATKWETATKVVLPSASSGVIASVLLGLGRAIGETMVVTLAAGRVANLTFNPTEEVQTMTAYIAQVATGDIPPGVAVDAAFAVGMVLFIMTYIINIFAGIVVDRIKAGKRMKRTGLTGGLVKVIGAPGRVLSKINIGAGLKKGAGSLRRRYRIGIFGISMTGSSLVIAIGFLAYLVHYILTQGLSGIDQAFLSEIPHYIPDKAGIYPVILGSVYLMLLTLVISVPIGVGAAIYLTEIAPDSRHTRFLRRIIQNLAGVPSIVFGLVGLTIFVRLFDFGISLLAGSMTLSIMVLPIIVVSTEEALKAVPKSFRDAALALGATRWTTIRHHVLPNAIPGIMTGSILAMSRAIGETAPILFIGSVFAKVPPSGIMDPFLALPLTIFYWTTHPKAEFHELAASTIIVLLVILLTMNSVAIVIRNRVQAKRDW